MKPEQVTKKWAAAPICLVIILEILIPRTGWGGQEQGVFKNLPAKEKQALDQKVKPTFQKSDAIIQISHANLDVEFLLNSAIKPFLNVGTANPVMFNLLDKVSLLVVTERVDVLKDGLKWVGHVQGDKNSRALFIVKGNTVFGDIRIKGRVYQVRPTGDKTHLLDVYSITEIDSTKFPIEAPPRRPPYKNKLPSRSRQGALGHAEQHMAEGSTPRQPGRPKTKSGAIIMTATDAFAQPICLDHDSQYIDVMVGYTTATKDAFAQLGSDIEQEISFAADEANETFTSSGIQMRVRVVHMIEMNYADATFQLLSQDLNIPLALLTENSDGEFDAIHTLRDTHAADLVSLWVEEGDNCGMANLLIPENAQTHQPAAFSVVRWDCARGNLSFVHELGHSMGADHDRFALQKHEASFVNSDQKYNYGFVDLSQAWRTIMAVDSECQSNGDSCERLGFWSNPENHHGGIPVGIQPKTIGGQEVGGIDNRRTIDENASSVAHLKMSAQDIECSALLDNQPPIAPTNLLFQ